MFHKWSSFPRLSLLRSHSSWSVPLCDRLTEGPLHMCGCHTGSRLTPGGRRHHRGFRPEVGWWRWMWRSTRWRFTLSYRLQLCNNQRFRSFHLICFTGGRFCGSGWVWMSVQMQLITCKCQALIIAWSLSWVWLQPNQVLTYTQVLEGP